MKRVAVIQARTSSSRLPAKVLLPLAGVPISILAARRAMNTGIPLIVATSVESDDDGLVEQLRASGLPFYRGSLQDTLGRFVEALIDWDDETIVVRLTADNVLPDGPLLDELIKDFVERRLDYLRCNGEHSGLPYGVSAEVTLLRHLREAANKADADFDREHVTPYIERKFGVAYFEKYKDLGKGHFRCTIDNYDDFIEMQRVFLGESHPVTVPALDLVARLEGGRYQPLAGVTASQLVVGGAQLGMAYGIANSAGRPAKSIATEILKSAISNGAMEIDTAHAYGESEAVIGAALNGGWSDRARIITKLSPLTECDPETPLDVVCAKIEASFYASCAKLQRRSLDVLLLHRADHLQLWNGLAWRCLSDLRESGLVRTIGVSIQRPEELEAALDADGVGFIQLPFNVLDWRWEEAICKLRAARSKKPIRVHARSALLQGLLCTRDPVLWRQANVSAPEHVWKWLDACVSRFQRTNVVDLCLAFVRSQSWIDGVVVGMETVDQVAANVGYFSAPPLEPEQVRDMERRRPRIEAESLNPSCWLRGAHE